MRVVVVVVGFDVRRELIIGVPLGRDVDIEMLMDERLAGKEVVNVRGGKDQQAHQRGYGDERHTDAGFAAHAHRFSIWVALAQMSTVHAAPVKGDDAV